jgi:general secretion pathway protein G
MARGLRRATGFSILEMVVVLVLAGLVIGFFVIRAGGMADQNRMETARGDLRALQTAIQSYYLSNDNVFPAGNDWQSGDLSGDDPRILRQILYDPFQAAGTEYEYASSGNGKYYVVFSMGPDQAADITGINNSGQLTGSNDDDIFRTNGTGTFA